MHITLTKDYSVKADTTLLGYQGETNSRKITFSGLVIDGCNLYKLQILYSDGKVYELPIQDEVVTITGSILREIGYVSCQLLGYSVSGSDYTIVFKSNIFELEIKEAIDGEVAPIPPYEEATGALEKILAGVEAAKGYSESAETAAERAETARAEAVKSQNDAKVSEAQASTAAQQTEADKVITAGYAKTAKENADSTSADRLAIQTLAEQVTVDKDNVAENAAKVADDRTAAETAAQTAQSIADSLPEDYTTAVGKIAENTAEIANVKLTDKELQRRVNALYDLGNGITHQFETDSETAYAKTVPTGAKLMSVKSIGGHSEVIGGGIVSAGVTEVVEQGKNLWDEIWGVGSISPSSGDNEGDTATIYSKNYIPIFPNLTYIFVYTGSANISIVRVRFYDHNKKFIGIKDNNGKIVYPNRTFITPSNAFYVRFVLPPEYGNVYKNDIALIADSSTAYEPYHSNVYQIPEAIRNLPGYGVEGNTVDYETKTYTQNNAIDGTEIKALDTPIVTDISNLIPDDFLRNIEVEAGGSVTFRNSNGDSYRIPVPSEEEYIVKLSEVGGTT